MQGKKVLVDKYLERKISKIERLQLEKWILKDADNLSYFKESMRKFNDDSEKLTFGSEDAFDAFLIKIETKKRKTQVQFKRVLSYAAVFVGLLLGTYIVFNNIRNEGFSESTVVQQKSNELENEIIITLADGSKRIINSSNEELITDSKGNVVANGSKGTLNFTSLENVATDDLTLNEVHIPYGEKLKIILSDKTEVWLNSGSTLKFPRNLNNSQTDNRMVYLTGEAFFDVTKNNNRPFVVKTDEIDIKVLGTQFNVSAYVQDESITTTLVEGAVNVYQSVTPETPLQLSPEDQASYKKTDSSFEKVKVDTDIYTSWMEGRLIIDNMSFQQIMTKLERTHNVKIINKLPELNQEVFKGEFENEKIEDILKTISLSKPFNYDIDQNIITITK